MQGQGIIDVVNSYIAIALKNGVVGVSLFAGFFLSVLGGIYRAMRRLGDKECEEYLLGRALLGSLAATMLIIFTVSSITFIPIVYWTLAGIGVAYIIMVRKRVRA
jgi:O-antigen ligase